MSPDSPVSPDSPLSLVVEVLIDASVQSHVETESLSQAAKLAANWRGYTEGEICVRVTDDETIRQLNREHLQHDFATDVISFAYVAQQSRIEGELIISIDTADRRAAEFGWNAIDEMRLYAVHGVLHLTGMDDHDSGDRLEMRKAERAIMLELGVKEIVRLGADAPQDSITEHRS